MPNKNDITGDTIITKKPTEKYRDGWDRIFGKSEQVTDQATDQVKKTTQELPQEIPQEIMQVEKD